MIFTRQEHRVLAGLLCLALLGSVLVWRQKAAREAAVADEVLVVVGPGDGPSPSKAGEQPLADGTSRKTSVDHPPEDQEPAWLVVHVAGAVYRPGVHPLAPGARVADAVAAAGGGTPKARLDLINLAARLEDGQKILIPDDKDAAAWTAGANGITGGTGLTVFPPWESGAVAGAAPGQAPAKININLADSAALDALPGIGPALAARIIAYRQDQGPFRRVEDIQLVPGIGPSKFQEIRERITVR